MICETARRIVTQSVGAICKQKVKDKKKPRICEVLEYGGEIGI